MKEVEKHYNMLLESGELQEVCPKAVGIWEKDKKIFNSYFNEIKSLLDDFESDFIDLDDSDL